MKRYYIFKDCTEIGATETHEEASEFIRMKQKRETHPILKSEFSIMYGEWEFVPYGKGPEE